MHSSTLRQDHPYTGMPRRFFEALDIPAMHPDGWSKCLIACGGDVVQAHALAVDWLEFVHSPIHGPETRAHYERMRGFKKSFGEAYQWDRRRFLRHMRGTLHGKRGAAEYWRKMTKGASRA